MLRTKGEVALVVDLGEVATKLERLGQYDAVLWEISRILVLVRTAQMDPLLAISTIAALGQNGLNRADWG